MILHPMMFPAGYIGEIARLSLVAEVDTTPKPGLVDRLDSGAHIDMDRDLFLVSARAIAPYLTQMAAAGYAWGGSPEKLFAYIRPMGIEAEWAMQKATDGVNTHKGLIFTLGLLCASAGLCYGRGGYFDGSEILALAGEMTSQTLELEFEKMKTREPQTHGEWLFYRYGIRGIRGEAAEGFPSIKKLSLPMLRALEKQVPNRNDLFLQLLLHLMSQVEDTNVLYRTDFETAVFVRQEAGRILNLGGVLTAEGYKEIEILNHTFIQKNISPGGCADLLAATIFLWLLENHTTINMEEEESA